MAAYQFIAPSWELPLSMTPEWQGREVDRELPPSPLVPPEIAARLVHIKQSADLVLSRRPAVQTATLGLGMLVTGLRALVVMKREPPLLGPNPGPIPWDVLCEILHPPGVPGTLYIHDLEIDPTPSRYTLPVYDGEDTYRGPGKRQLVVTPDQLQREWGGFADSAMSTPSGSIIWRRVPMPPKSYWRDWRIYLGTEPGQ